MLQQDEAMRMHTDKFMSLTGLGLGLVFLLTSSASAAELPSRKPGLWEVKTTIGDVSRALVVQQCIDAATDQALQSSAGPFSAPACPDRDVKTSDGSMTIDSRCSIAGKSGSAHAIVIGSFDSAYTMTVTAEGGGLPAVKMTIEGKWLGACAAGQQAGDVIMPGGVKLNLPELQKRTPTQDPLQQAK
jgi:Protein of unknown function (DUF3617)